MAKGDHAFKYSDAWLLLALIYGRKPSDREQIISIGDFIDHSIFNEDELEGGLQRLTDAGYVHQLDGGMYQPSPAVLEWYDRVSPKRSYVQKDRERVEKYLKLSDDDREAWLKDAFRAEDRRAVHLFVVFEDDGLKESLLSFLQKEGFLPKVESVKDIYDREPTFGPHGEAIFFVYTGGDKDLLYDLAKHIRETWATQGFVGYVAFQPEVLEPEDIRKFWALNPVKGYDTPTSFVAWNLPTIEFQKTLPLLIGMIYEWTFLERTSRFE